MATMKQSASMSKNRSRLQAAEAVLKKCEEKLEQAERVKIEKFSDTEMAANARVAAEGLDLNVVVDELRSMKLAPPAVVEIIARCVCTLASGDDMGDHEHRAAEAAKENARKKKNAQAVAKGQPPPKPLVGTMVSEKRKLLSWEESQKVLARANFKERISDFDGRLLLDNDDLVNEVRSRLDLDSIDPSLPMAAHLEVKKLSKKERNDEAIAAVRRREAYNEGVAQDGSGGVPKLTLNDARYVSKIAPPLLVWIARVISQYAINDPLWKRTSAACIDATKKRDEARDAVMQLRRKMDEMAQKLREEKARLKAERERAEEEGVLLELQALEQQKLQTEEKNQTDKPKELTTPDQIILTGPTPNIFFQNGRISGIAPSPVQLSPRLQLPATIYFFIRVKHCRVSFPFPPSLPTERYLHKAQVIPGHEEAGPVAHVPFDGAHVIGLYEHEHLSFMQLVLEVPSTPTINPSIHPTRLSFHPRHSAQLHSGSGGAGTTEMPRIIVTAYPHLVSRHDARMMAVSRAASAPPRTEGSRADDLASVASASIVGSLFSKSSNGPSVPFIPPGMDVVPLLTLPEGLRSIGSAYKSVPLLRGLATIKPDGSPARVRANSVKNQEQDWSRVALALSARAHSKPFALSQPGQQRPIPEILLQHPAVALDSAKRLTRSTTKVGTGYIKIIATLVAKVSEGYMLSHDEKRRLREAADMEAEVERTEKQVDAANAAERRQARDMALKAATARASAADAAADLQVPLRQRQLGDEGDAQSVASCTPSTSSTAATGGKRPAEIKLPVPDIFSTMFDPSVANAAALAVGAAASPAAVELAQDAFAAAVEATFAKAGAAGTAAAASTSSSVQPTPPHLKTPSPASSASGKASARKSARGESPRGKSSPRAASPRGSTPRRSSPGPAKSKAKAGPNLQVNSDKIPAGEDAR